MTENLPNKELLRPDEAAKYLSISVKTLYNWISQGRIPAIRLRSSNLLRIKREDVLAILRPVDE